MTFTTWNHRGTGLVRAAVLLGLAISVTLPAAAQLGPASKKVRGMTGRPAAESPPATPTVAASGGGTVVLTDEVLDRFLGGLRAGQVEREKAAGENTPYGHYRQAQSAYATAKLKCDAAAQTYAQRMAADSVLLARNSALLEKMTAAMQRMDTAMQRQLGDSMLAMQDPSCTVKQPVQPNDWFDMQRSVDQRASHSELTASGFDAQEMGLVRDRAEAIIRDAPPPDVSASESAAVEKRRHDLERALGIDAVPAARAEKPAPPAPPQPASPATPAGQSAMNECMSKNAAKHDAEIRRLGEKVQDAHAGGNTDAAMAISDSIRRLMMAGCNDS